MKPYLKNIRTGDVQKAVSRRLTTGDLKDLMQLQQAAVDTLPDGGAYLPKTRQQFEEILEGGDIFGIFTGSELRGACTLQIPGNADTLGSDAGIPAEEHAGCAVIGAVFAAPDYRKNGIGHELIYTAVKAAVDRHEAQHVLSAISPKNIGCILSFMSINGFRVKSLRQMEGCRLRYILCYSAQDKRLFTQYERYDVTDVYSISKALANGHEGIATFKNRDGVFMWLAK